MYIFICTILQFCIARDAFAFDNVEKDNAPLFRFFYLCAWGERNVYENILNIIRIYKPDGNKDSLPRIDTVKLCIASKKLYLMMQILFYSFSFQLYFHMLDWYTYKIVCKELLKVHSTYFYPFNFLTCNIPTEMSFFYTFCFHQID